ncbi:winged helix-turn-helix transcriptional regulator [Halobacteria archaeon AArc-dxtr1]|nr:winged helix-turn-helix transcriptional regulator [Halobacteria archaeon AArc-dxtr1]
MPSGPDHGGDALVATLSLLSRKWTTRIVRALDAEGPLGFSSLESAVPGVSAKVLTQRLEALIDAGVVQRTVVSESPLRVEYTLSEAGRELEAVFDSLEDWGERHLVTDRPTLVVADEDRRFTDIVRRWFDESYTVRRAHDREELVEAVDERTTVLLSDTHLPGTAHLEISGLIDGASPDCRFVALRTGRIGLSVLDLDCDAVVRKPLSKTALGEIVMTQVDRYGEDALEREYHALCAKRNALQENVSEAVLDGDERFAALEDRIVALASERDGE